MTLSALRLCFRRKGLALVALLAAAAGCARPRVDVYGPMQIVLNNGNDLCLAIEPYLPEKGSSYPAQTCVGRGYALDLRDGTRIPLWLGAPAPIRWPNLYAERIFRAGHFRAFFYTDDPNFICYIHHYGIGKGGMNQSFMYSLDRGRHWTPLDAQHLDHMPAAILYREGALLVVGGRGGLTRLEDLPRSGPCFFAQRQADGSLTEFRRFNMARAGDGPWTWDLSFGKTLTLGHTNVDDPTYRATFRMPEVHQLTWFENTVVEPGPAGRK